MISRLFPVFVILVSIGLFFGYINPLWTGAIAKTSAEIKSYEGAKKAAESYKAKEKELIAKQNSIAEGDRNRVKAFLPDGVDNVQLILDLDSLAKRSGVELSNFETSKEDAKAAAAASQSTGSLPLDSAKSVLTGNIKFSVTATGTYEAFRTFLGGVEKSLRPLDLVDIQIKSSPTGIYSYEMTFIIYWLR